MSVDGLITALEPQRRRGGQRINVFVDGNFSFSLEKELAARLWVGQPIEQLKTVELLREDEQARAMEAALVYFTQRPRSERELRDFLARRETPPEVTESLVRRLGELNLVDDAAFARYWVENRQQHRPRGGRLLKLELRRKGIADEIATEAVQAGVEQEEPVAAAYRAGQRKAQGLNRLEPPEFQNRLGQYLQRRGFDYEAVRAAVRQLAAEVRSEAESDPRGRSCAM
jgi:regulatory protein